MAKKGINFDVILVINAKLSKITQKLTTASKNLSIIIPVIQKLEYLDDKVTSFTVQEHIDRVVSF